MWYNFQPKHQSLIQTATEIASIHQRVTSSHSPVPGSRSKIFHFFIFLCLFLQIRGGKKNEGGEEGVEGKEHGTNKGEERKRKKKRNKEKKGNEKT